MRAVAPLLFASVLVAGAMPAASHDLTGCWSHMELQSFDGLAVQPQASSVLDFCFPKARRHGLISAASFGAGCGLGFDIRYRLGRGTILLRPSQWPAKTTLFTYRFGNRGETLILEAAGEGPMVFERLKRPDTRTIAVHP
jgi:hypothetical protein